MFTQYDPYIGICIFIIILIVLFILFGEQNTQSIISNPDSCESIHNLINITPRTGFDPVTNKNCIPSEIVCPQEITAANNPIDNTPDIPIEFQEDLVCAFEKDTQVCTGSNKSVEVKKRGRFISKGERMCCQTMERIYGVPFSTIRPKWLSNPETKRNLELDCYNDDLKIAVEYNGAQHYKWPNFTNQTYEQFINQIRRDKLKFELCDKNGVYLIVVPYNIPHDKISPYIISHLPETLQKRIKEENIFDSKT